MLRAALLVASVGVWLACYGRLGSPWGGTLGRPAQVRGVVSDTRFRAERIEQQALGPLGAAIETVVRSTALRLFRVDYTRACPFWVEEYLCQEGGGECGVCPCEESDVPASWRREDAVVPAHVAADGAADEWVAQDSRPEYVDLELNPERFTGYGGFGAARTWMAIYKENCFRGPEANCFEERVFYRLISGFHASTSAHICAQHESGADPACYMRALGAFEDRITNVYFLYAFLLRALHAQAARLRDAPIQTGAADDDALVAFSLRHVADAVAECQACDDAPIFDEAALFADAAFADADVRLEYMAQFRQKFRNISEILDCVACETCKVHAKLQVLGIGTALKVLLSPDPAAVILTRNELVALLNTVHKTGETIQIIRSFTTAIQSEISLTQMAYFALTSSTILIFALFR